MFERLNETASVRDVYLRLIRRMDGGGALQKCPSIPLETSEFREWCRRAV